MAKTQFEVITSVDVGGGGVPQRRNGWSRYRWSRAEPVVQMAASVVCAARSGIEIHAGADRGRHRDARIAGAGWRDRDRAWWDTAADHRRGCGAGGAAHSPSFRLSLSLACFHLEGRSPWVDGLLPWGVRRRTNT
jgi:hypothetical protein